ncbi:MAG: FimV/HubP family polar landmark protein [Steroidobacteraceae bacterium]
MKSAVRRVLLLSALMSPNALYALGLGEIHLHSALNQPFDADIDLVAAGDEDLSALRASLAPSDVFVRYGLDKPGYLADFTFRVVRGPDGKDYLKVTSPRPVTEPFVTLLVQADWPRGKLLREYTVLLDPPVFAPAQPAAEPQVATPRVQSGASAPAPAPRAEPAASGSASPVASTSATVGSTYRVRPNDTLWKIASEAHPGSRSDVNRAMVAIYQANPHSFDGNINILRAGSSLRIPDADEISAIPAAAAAAEVSRQYQLWRESSAAAQPAESTEGRLRLVTPEQGTTAASTATTSAPAATQPAGAPTTDMQARVKQLEAELAEARRLLEVRNAELATLQGQAAAGQPAAGQPAAGAQPPAGAPAQPPAGAAQAPEAAAPGAAAPEAAQPAPEAAAPAPAQPAPAPAPEVKKPTPKPTPAAKPPAEGPSLLERLAGYWWIVAGLLAAVLAFVFYRRSKGESADKEVDLQEALARTRTDLRARPAPRDAAIVVEERRPVAPAAVPKVAPAAAPRAPEPSRKPVSIEDTISGEEPVSIEAGDPLAEADFHMAYGLYDQAADLVQLAIKRAPQRRELKLKLLEIFFVWGNRDRFLELAREMQASRADAPAGEWDKILIMGKQIAPEEAIFAGPAPSLKSSLDMELHSRQGPLDIDLGAGQGATPDVDLSDGAARSPDESGLDFVFTEPAVGTDSTSIVPTVEMPQVPTVEIAQVPTVEMPQVATVEMPHIKAQRAASEDPTQELPVEELGLDVGHLGSLDDTSGGEDLLALSPRSVVEDTVERPRMTSKAARLDDEEDLLDATGMHKEQTGILKALDATAEMPDLQYGEATGELPTIETARIERGAAGEVDFDLGSEPSTMSEVGTKLDLARAYVDMGDPEGARSILDEVLKEGSSDQKKEAERLIASLP